MIEKRQSQLEIAWIVLTLAKTYSRKLKKLEIVVFGLAHEMTSRSKILLPYLEFTVGEISVNELKMKSFFC